MAGVYQRFGVIWLGEAKSRRREDGFYGRLPKSGYGVIFPEPISVFKNGIKTTQFDGAAFRRSLLYWDKISCPTNNVLSIGLPEETRTLESEGILHRPVHKLGSLSSGSPYKFYSEIYKSEIVRLDKEDPGRWSFLDLPDGVSIADVILAKNAGVEIQLAQCIPVPCAEIPIDELLEFKQRRRDKIIEMRLALNESTLKVIESEKTELALAIEIDKIDRRICDVVKVARENKYDFGLSNLKINFSLGSDKIIDAVVKAGLGATVGAQYGLSLVGGAVAGASPFFSISSSWGRKSATEVDRNPFRVVGEVEKEFRL